MRFLKFQKPSTGGYSGQDYTGIILEMVTVTFFSTKINVFLVYRHKFNCVSQAFYLVI